MGSYYVAVNKNTALRPRFPLYGVHFGKYMNFCWCLHGDLFPANATKNAVISIVLLYKKQHLGCFFLPSGIFNTPFFPHVKKKNTQRNKKDILA